MRASREGLLAAAQYTVPSFRRYRCSPSFDETSISIVGTIGLVAGRGACGRKNNEDARDCVTIPSPSIRRPVLPHVPLLAVDQADQHVDVGVVGFIAGGAVADFEHERVAVAAVDEVVA